MGATRCADTCQSTYYFKDSGLLLTLYVNDMVLSGPAVAHGPFWQQIRKFIEIEEPAPVSRVLVRNNQLVDDEQGKGMLVGHG